MRKEHPKATGQVKIGVRRSRAELDESSEEETVEGLVAAVKDKGKRKSSPELMEPKDIPKNAKKVGRSVDLVLSIRLIAINAVRSTLLVRDVQGFLCHMFVISCPVLLGVSNAAMIARPARSGAMDPRGNGRRLWRISRRRRVRGLVEVKISLH